MSRLVRWGSAFVPRALVEPAGTVQPGVCPQCGGLGSVPEQIDRDRFDEMVPCWRCRMYCKTCKWVPKEGHEHGEKNV
jgi:hypothetical protein